MWQVSRLYLECEEGISDMKAQLKNNYPIWEDKLFCLAMAFLIFMMLFNLTHSALWGDEWVEYMISRQPLGSGHRYSLIAGTFQPPLYNFIMYFWLKINSDILWFRLFNVFLGAISGYFLYKTVAKLANIRFAAFTLFALGATYRWIYCIQECSEYALMLMFLFMSLYFYVLMEEEDSNKTEVLFILSCVGAVYSQYGSFFVVAPLLVLHLIRKCLTKQKNIIIKTIGGYVFSFIVFAVPLYIFYASKQLMNNEIGENADIVVSYDVFKDFFFVFGKVLGYFLDLNRRAYAGKIMPILGIVFLLLGILIIFQSRVSWFKKSLIAALIIGYVLFYWMVVFHIYAMVHPNESAGFYDRYSYFFIPIVFVVLPMIIYEAVSCVSKESIQKKLSVVIAYAFGLMIMLSYPALLENWHKTYDDIFARIWVYNAGFKDTTFLFGTASWGFDYYTSQYKYGKTGQVLSSDAVDLQNLPESFWVWRTAWGGENWKTVVDAARGMGYNVTVYGDYGKSQLFYW